MKKSFSIRAVMLVISGLARVAMLYGQDQYSYRGFDNPTCVVRYGGHYYLACAGRNDGGTDRDGDGYIASLRSDGSQQTADKRFITGLNNPQGLCAVEGVLYISDMDRIIGYSLSSRKKVFETSLADAGTVALAGMASDDGTLYVAASDTGAVFAVDIATGKYERWADIKSPRSLLVDDDRLYLCSWGDDSTANGQIGYLERDTRDFRRVGHVTGRFWGLALSGKRLYFCDREQLAGIRWVNVKNGDEGLIRLTTPMKCPAGFIYEAGNNLFIIPDMCKGLVYGALGFK